MCDQHSLFSPLDNRPWSCLVTCLWITVVHLFSEPPPGEYLSFAAAAAALSAPWKVLSGDSHALS